MYVRRGAKVRLVTLESLSLAANISQYDGKEYATPEVAESARKHDYQRAFFPDTDDPEFRWFVLPSHYRWVHHTEAKVSLGLYYGAVDVDRTGSLGYCLVEDPAGGHGALLLLSNPTSDGKPRRLLTWVTSAVIGLTGSPSFSTIAKQNDTLRGLAGQSADIWGVQPVNLTFAEQFQSRQLLVGGRFQIAVATEMLRAMMRHRELAIIIE